MLLPRALLAFSATARLAPGRSSRLAHRSASAVGTVAIAGLVAFHAALLLEHFADATIAQPEVLAQWAGALLLGAGACALRRQGRSLLTGRSALVFWLLVLLLHVGFGTGITVTGGETGSSRELLLLLPLATFAAACGSGGRASRRLAAPRDSGAFGLGSVRFRPSPATSSAGAGPHRFSPRPPPLS